ncbi:MAG: fumarylacetoacetate hydrolase family protein [Deltaproteobacteria bacterium]|nr:fumarylacetoacetate hydrolase family protein [Deltaproteobacteria bacterium]
MRIVSFIRDGRSSIGVVSGGDRIVDARTVLDPSLGDVVGCAADLQGVIEANALDRLRPLEDRAGDFGLDEITLLPVVRRPEKILCVGLNYDAHRIETGREETKHPVLFTRFASTLIGHGQSLVRPLASSKLDYEGELAVIIGKRGRRVPLEHALDLVAGYTCFNDASVRDWQRHTHQFTPGKNFPSTGALGPWLVTRDAIEDPQSFALRTRVNGKEVQSGHTAQMIFSVRDLIHYITQFCELAPGDVIATGTPSGVGYRRDPPLYLCPGDVVEVDIEGIGCLRNPVVAEASDA